MPLVPFQSEIEKKLTRDALFTTELERPRGTRPPHPQPPTPGVPTATPTAVLPPGQGIDAFQQAGRQTVNTVAPSAVPGQVADQDPILQPLRLEEPSFPFEQPPTEREQAITEARGRRLADPLSILDFDKATAQLARRATERIPDVLTKAFVPLGGIDAVMQMFRDPFRPGGDQERAAAEAANQITKRIAESEGREFTEGVQPPKLPPLFERFRELVKAEEQEPAGAQAVGQSAATVLNLVPGLGFVPLGRNAARIAAGRTAAKAAGGEGIELLGRPITQRVAGGVDDIIPGQKALPAPDVPVAPRSLLETTEVTDPLLEIQRVERNRALAQRIVKNDPQEPPGPFVKNTRGRSRKRAAALRARIDEIDGGGRGGGRSGRGGRGGRGPNRPLPPPGNPLEAFFDDILDLPPGMKADEAAFARFQGLMNSMGNDLVAGMKEGTRGLKRDGFLPTKEHMEELYLALHGEINAQQLSRVMRRHHDELRRTQDLLDEMMIRFFRRVGRSDSKLLASDAAVFIRRMLGQPEYFPRSWKFQGKAFTGFGRRSAESSRGFKKPRQGASFSEMLGDGWEPTSWDPYTQFGLATLDKFEYMMTVGLMNQLKRTGFLLPANGAPANWRIPNVRSPLFRGRTMVVDGKEFTTPAFALHPRTANIMEVTFGWQPPSLHIGPVDITREFTRITNGLKRMNLMGSLFQHIDVGFTRPLIASATMEGILHGGPARLPSMWKGMATGHFDRQAVKDALNSTDEIVKGSGVTHRMIVENGLLTGDPTVLVRQVADELDTYGVGLKGLPLRKLKQVRDFMEGGLFTAVYGRAQEYSLKNWIVPALLRRHRDWSPQQIAFQAAREANLFTSSIPVWQSSIKNPGFRWALERIIFSTSEQEGLIKQAIAALTIRDKGLWTENWAGAFIAFTILANAINFWATGKSLPEQAYLPIDLHDPSALIKFDEFGISYNQRFMSPQVPYMTGENGEPIYLDLMGQMDTAFQWLEPSRALASRLNIGVGAARDQIRGETFTGDPLGDFDDPKRWVNLLSDVFAPFSIEEVLQAVRTRSEPLQKVLPGVEPQLDFAGHMVQALGVNLRTMTTPQTQDLIAQTFFEQGVFDEIDPVEADKLSDPTYRDLPPKFKDRVNQHSFLVERRDRNQEKRRALGDPLTIKLDEADERFTGRLQGIRSEDGHIHASRVAWEAISEYLELRSNAFRHLITEDDKKRQAAAAKIVGDPAVVLRQAYFSVDLPFDPNTGELDFDQMDSEREKVLKTADELGINRELIAGRGSIFPDNPEADALVTRRRNDSEKMRGYWNAGEGAFGEERQARRDLYLAQHPDVWSLLYKWDFKFLPGQQDIMDVERSYQEQDLPIPESVLQQKRTLNQVELQVRGLLEKSGVR